MSANVSRDQNVPRDHAMNSSPVNGFATTQWSLVQSAGRTSSPSAKVALSKLCEVYWPPVYAFIRRKGHSVADAEDLTQAFFVHILETSFMAAADRNRGRFRSFLLASVTNFLNAQHRFHKAEKRGGNQAVVSLNIEFAEERFLKDSSASLSAEQLFERQWSLTLIQNAMNQLKLEYQSHGHSQLFELLEPLMNGATERTPYAQLSDQLGMSEDAIKQAARRLRIRYRELLRTAIAETVSSKEEIDDELRDLMNSLS